MSTVHAALAWFTTPHGRIAAAIALFFCMQALKRPWVEANVLKTERLRLFAVAVLAAGPAIPLLADGTVPFDTVAITAGEAFLGALGVHIGLKKLSGKGDESWLDWFAATVLPKGGSGATIFVIATPLFLLCGCTKQEARDATKEALDVSNAICEQLDGTLQDEPDFVKFTCSAIGIGDQAAHIFLAKVKRDDAPVFAARHAKPCSEDAEVAP